MLIGLGTGRCGTGSLAETLGLNHEAAVLPWKKSLVRLGCVWQGVRRSKGDVGSYWLPYVEDVLEREPDTRFVCLQREREATCRSWERMHAARDRFAVEVPWRQPDGVIKVINLMPDSDKPVAEAVRDYYDDYYREARRLAQKHPKRFRIFESPKVLNDRKLQREMLRFSGLRQSVTRSRVHTKKNPDAVRLYHTVQGAAMEAFKRGERRIFIPQDVIDKHGIDAANQMVKIKVY